MKHDLNVIVSKAPKKDALISCKTITMRERVLRFLFGQKQQVVVLVPGRSIEDIFIYEMKKEGEKDGQGDPG